MIVSHKNYFQMFNILLFLLFFFSESAIADNQHDGWWFCPEESGSGLSIEIQGYTMFAALYTYSPNTSIEGYPIWFSSAAMYNPEQNAYVGRLLYWINGSYDDIYPVNPIPVDVGTFIIRFTSIDEAILTYSLNNQPIGPIRLQKFLKTIAPGENDTRLRGWWYTPKYDGWGFFLEAQGGKLFGAWYFYMPLEDVELPIPTWVAFGGDFQNGSNSFSSPVTVWHNGSILGVAPYQPPQPTDANTTVYLDINPDGTIYIRESGDDEILHLQRFRFSP